MTVMEHLYGYRMPNISVFVYVILRLVIRLSNESFDMYIIMLKKNLTFVRLQTVRFPAVCMGYNLPSLQTFRLLIYWTHTSCGCNSVVEYELPKLGTRVRSPSSAPKQRGSTRYRVESLLHMSFFFQIIISL